MNEKPLPDKTSAESGLEEYQGKRNFDRSPEPRGTSESGQGTLRFVVQKHDSSHLHYDLRLELGGVMKSWAVPKGPSMNPLDKRLAVMTEDHPLDYRTFEGVIPEGNYGAGTVMVWDAGEYCASSTCDPAETERIIREGIEKGHLSFRMNGRKLHGRFALAKMKRAQPEDAWLLFKSDDEFATDEDITTSDLSVMTGRSMDQISADSKGADLSQQLNLGDAPESPMPHNVSPMLATLTDEAFDRPGWLFEVKWDGYRAIAEIENGKVRLYSRNNQTFNDRFPSIVESLRKIGLQAVLDGEVVAVDENGIPQFQLLQRYQNTGSGRLIYYVFDILYLEGHDVRNLPLVRRKEILRTILPEIQNVKFSDDIAEQGILLFNQASGIGLEGIMAKKSDSPYRTGVRSREWLKVRARLSQEFVIGGYTEPRGSRSHLGALVLGVYEGDTLVYVGHAGSGLSEEDLSLLYSRLKPLERRTSPFTTPLKTNMPAHWVEPELVIEVEFHGWTEDGLLRQPVIIGLREDKNAREVRLESPETAEPPRGKFAVKPKAAQDKEIAIGTRTLKLTNLNKVFWPDDGYTKGDLIDYYRDVAQFILPYLHDRPQSLNRHPDGINGESFFQKNVSDSAIPDWLQTVQIPSDEEVGRNINYLLCQDEAALIFLANLGCIELNPWNSRVGHLDQPDYTVLDLDPLETPFDNVIRAAEEIRGILEGIGVQSYPKTSGATGLHIYIPLGNKYDYAQARGFANIIAILTNRRLPDITSVERNPARRRGRVYLDYLQNGRGKTLASAYCVRPQPHASVSTPLRWDEVHAGLDPTSFNIRTIRNRLDSIGDIFKPILGRGINLAQAIEHLQADS